MPSIEDMWWINTTLTKPVHTEYFTNQPFSYRLPQQLVSARYSARIRLVN